MCPSWIIYSSNVHVENRVSQQIYASAGHSDLGFLRELFSLLALKLCLLISVVLESWLPGV